MKIFKVKVKPPTKTYTYSPTVYKGGYAGGTTTYKGNGSSATTYPASYGTQYGAAGTAGTGGPHSSGGRSVGPTTHGEYKFDRDKDKGGSAPATKYPVTRANGNVVTVTPGQRTSHLRMDWEETKNNLNLPRFVEKAKPATPVVISPDEYNDYD
jgi:hypothetical protein